MSETGNQCQAPLPFEMSEKIKQIDPAGLLNEESSDQEMDTQDLPGSHSELREQKKKTVHNFSSSGEEEEEGENAAAAAAKGPSATAAAADDANPKTFSAVANPGFRIVDIELTGSGSGLSVQPGQMSQTTAATAAVNAAATFMNLNLETGASTPNPLPQRQDPAANNYRPSTDPVPGQSRTGPAEKLSAAIARAKEQNRNEKNVESGGKNNKNENSFKKVPTGVKKPEIPVKNSAVSEADAVPSRTYSAIISNKKRTRRQAPLVA